MQSDVSPDSEGVFQEHIALVENIHGLIDYVTLKSNLLLDADLASDHLMSIAQSEPRRIGDGRRKSTKCGHGGTGERRNGIPQRSGEHPGDDRWAI